MPMHHPKILEIVRHDPRFDAHAYEFIFEGLAHTQKTLGRGASNKPKDESHHVTGLELVRGICELAKQEFGLLAEVVFRMWGIRSTDDIGEIVFNLIDAELLSKTERDSREDFRAVLDLQKELRDVVAVRREDIAWLRPNDR